MTAGGNPAPGPAIPVANRGAEARIVLRPLANPLPLGFLALAAGTLLLAGLQLGWLGAEEGQSVALALLAFVFPLQLLASIFGYLCRDIVAGTGMGVLSGTWLTISLVMLTSPPGSTSDALGLFLLLAFVAMLIPASAASLGKLIPAAVLGTAGLRFGVTGIYELSASSTWEDIAGVVGLALCALALYTALAMALEDAQRRTVLPLGRRATGRAAMEGGLGDHDSDLEREAGVREQL
jgi:succinate-acetate transporter protein